MKILFITPYPPPMGGIANWAKIVTNYIQENIEDVEYKYINTAPRKRITEGRSLLNRVFGGFFSIIRTKKQLKKDLKNFKPDVVHINTSGSLALFRDIKVLKILKKHNIRSVLHIRYGRVPDVLQTNSLEFKLLNKAFNLSSKIIAIDAKTYEAIKIKYADKVVNIPNPFSAENMPEARCLSEDVCSFKVSYLGWVVNTKGIEELVSAWNKISKKYSTWQLDLIGPYKEEYLSELKQKYSFENINIVGELPHDAAMDKINDSDIFILPSYTEGFPNVILEAMHLGKAIIATNVGAIPEILGNNTGIVINAKSEKDIIDSLELLLNNSNLRVEYSKKAKEESKQYLLENVLKTYTKVWFDR